MLAVITGASRGLGRLCASELAAHGANLLLVARDQMALDAVAAEIKSKYPARKIKTLGCDLRDPDAPQHVRDAADQFGRVDILVNNAAIQGPIGPACEVPWREFEEAVRYQTRALEDPTLRKDLRPGARQRLELYRQKKPFRDQGP